MATEKRLIDANALLLSIRTTLVRIKQKYAKNPIISDILDIFDELVIGMVKKAPTVDAVEVADMREFAEDVVYQFGYYCQNGGRLHITHGGLSTLEHAFDILGWENPHPVPVLECEIEGCHEHATCGTPTADGYKRMCGKHYLKHYTKMDGDGNE